MQLTGWHHVALPVPDLDASVRWYSRVLRGTVYRRTDLDPRDVNTGRTAQVWMRVGDAVVNLAQADVVPRQPDQHFFHYAVSTSGGDLPAWMAHLQEEGVDVLGPYGHGGLSFVSIYFDDPDGYRWELIIDFADFESARSAASEYGGKLGNPTASYDWD